MSTPKDIHRASFDEGTLAKLELFRLYVREWLPVFFVRRPAKYKRVNVFDAFCGPGEDAAGQPGSPLLTLQTVEEYQLQIEASDAKLTLHFSDEDAEKVSALRAKVASCSLPVTLEFESRPFDKLLPEMLRELRRPDSANLVILDQYGISDVGEDVFRELSSCPTTDLLFFVASSTFHRFTEHPSVRKYLETHRAGDYHHAHRAVVGSYRKLIPADREYSLFRATGNPTSLT